MEKCVIRHLLQGLVSKGTETMDSMKLDMLHFHVFYGCFVVCDLKLWKATFGKVRYAICFIACFGLGLGRATCVS